MKEGAIHADVKSLDVSDKEFEDWVTRHEHVRDAGIDLVPERNEQMTGTYVMLDARGRFFTNADGRCTPLCFALYSSSLLEKVREKVEKFGFLSGGLVCFGCSCFEIVASMQRPTCSVLLCWK